MAGHSQFANIMHRKGAQDKKRARLFARLTREIIVAAKSGLPDPAMNPRLRTAVLAARAQNVPRDNIERAIKRATGEDKDTNYEALRYEGYGPGGIAIIVEALTDNRNRTAGEVRMLFSKNGGALGESNSVTFLFERVGHLSFAADVASADKVFETALEAGASDVQSSEAGHEVYCAVEDFSTVRDALSEKIGDAREAGLTWKPLNSIPVEGENAEKLVGLIEALEENDDVQSVAANYDIADDVLTRLAG